MKKIAVFAVAVLAAALAQAQVANKAEDAIRVHYASASATASSHIVLVDISDTANYAHGHMGTRSVDIHKISVALDRAADAAGTVKIGVVTFVDASSGTVKYFAEYKFTSTNQQTIVFSDDKLTRTGVAGANVGQSGATRYLVSGDVLASNAAFQTDVSLATSAGGTAAPGVGDIILTVTRTNANILNLVVDLWYTTTR